ncbi:MAG TPA: hypothetical protein VJ436_05325, partial [Anaerolineales bacterium]|nr:hypothetical protein [Anaerolineales bacterium]
IAGYSSYPWAVDWGKFRSIADAVGAFLFADIAHVAGLVAAGVYPSPVGYADVITFTTHKSLCGPRGACILTTDSSLARKIDRAVFPGEQGGPHVNVFAGIALTFKLAQTEQFRHLQAQIVKNCAALTARLQARGFRIPYGGTDTHLTNLDCRSVRGPDSTALSGDQAARLLDLAGIVVNRNTIPGDKSAANPSGIRLGTPWITQRGLREAETEAVADIIADVLQAATPYTMEGRKGGLGRAKVGFAALEEAWLRTRALAEGAGIDYEPSRHGYPHFYYLDDYASAGEGVFTLEISGENAAEFLNFAASSDLEALGPVESQPTKLFTPMGLVEGSIAKVSSQEYRLEVQGGGPAGLAAAWLRALSDGYVDFGDESGPSGLIRRLPGPVVVRCRPAGEGTAAGGNGAQDSAVSASKPYFIGVSSMEEAAAAGEALPAFTWQDQEAPLRRTPLYETHRRLAAKIIPFAGWEMPVWYSSVMEEHLAVRNAAGLFDVAHMGVYQAEGPEAAVFLDSVVGNDVAGLELGESLYTHLLDPHAQVIDDLLVYRRGPEEFLVVVNASNDDKDWAWLNAVWTGEVCVDKRRPWARAFGRNVRLRNLRDPKQGEAMRVDIALQGPRARDILLALGADEEHRERVLALKRTELCEAVVGGFDLVVSRTGYTGEKMAFELFVHPLRAEALFLALLEAGEPFGLKPCGLGARDSLRTEAGLPLYGHEMGAGSGRRGEPDLGVAEAGFGSYVKTYKPWFIGREAFLAREAKRNGVVARFRFDAKGVRMAHNGDPVIDRRGRVSGYVTSCAVDLDGYLTGQAYVELKAAEEGTPISIFQGAPELPGKAPSALGLGERVTIPIPASILSRFPK